MLKAYPKEFQQQCVDAVLVWARRARKSPPSTGSPPQLSPGGWLKPKAPKAQAAAPTCAKQTRIPKTQLKWPNESGSSSLRKSF